MSLHLIMNALWSICISRLYRYVVNHMNLSVWGFIGIHQNSHFSCVVFGLRYFYILCMNLSPLLFHDAELDLSVSRTGDQHVHRVFVDPGGKHCLAVLLGTGGAETYYTHAKWRKPRMLSKLKGLVINAVAWNRQQITEGSY
jgi:hypothetical protein